MVLRICTNLKIIIIIMHLTHIFFLLQKYFSVVESRIRDSFKYIQNSNITDIRTMETIINFVLFDKLNLEKTTSNIFSIKLVFLSFCFVKIPFVIQSLKRHNQWIDSVSWTKIIFLCFAQ